MARLSRKNIWLFNSGNEFSGNPKWLFVYVNKFRDDIYACYITDDKKIVRHIKSLGYRACLFKSAEGQRMMKLASVYVVEQCKELFPPEIQHATILNLWHGVGLKKIERGWDRGFLASNMAKKYIRYNMLYRNNMCFLVTSPFMEQHFIKMLDLREDQIIRAGYPRCDVPKQIKFASYNHKILKKKGLPSSTKIAVYAPTYREHISVNFLNRAFPDVERLITTLEQAQILLIIKLHPKIAHSLSYEVFKKLSRKSKYILLWDNKYDIYEVFGQVDLGIVDYSSIYYDMLAAGVPHYMRYVFDLEDERSTMIYDYEEHTHGRMCCSFEDLLDGLANYRASAASGKDDARRAEIVDMFMSYASEHSCSQIIDYVQSYQPSILAPDHMKNFYSFDLFDTLIRRRVLMPRGIFFKLMDRIKASGEGFPPIFYWDYADIRMQAEATEREYVRKDKGLYEITFDGIFNRIQTSYNLTDKQRQLLMQWELEAEYEDSIPCTERVQFAEELVKNGETVVFISDMYLPVDFVRRLVAKASPILAEVPIFLSSEQEVQKTTSLLYQKVYQAYAPWPYKEWHHYGDNANSDGKVARNMGIIPHIHTIPVMKGYDREFAERYKSYDSCLVGAMFARKITENKLNIKENFVYRYFSGMVIPYLAWCIRDAQRRGYKTLHFLARDGYFLCKAAQRFVEIHGLDIKIKYFYGSRRAWRIPSLVNEIDDEFFTPFGQFTAGVKDYKTLLKATCLTHDEFCKLFPEIKCPKRITATRREQFGEMFRCSEEYRALLLHKAAELRQPLIEYIRQEIDFTEPFAFVDFWGRGYTQTCLTRLLEVAAGKDIGSVFYYYRSILPSDAGNTRHNFSARNTSLLFVESVFNQMPYGTTIGFQKTKTNSTLKVDASRQEEYIEPKCEPNKGYDKGMYAALVRMLPEFVDDFYSLPLQNAPEVERMFSTWALSWITKKAADPVLVKSLAPMKNAVATFENGKEFAPQFTIRTLGRIARGKPATSFTNSVPMSLARSSSMVRSIYKSITKASDSKQNPLTRNLLKLVMKLVL